MPIAHVKNITIADGTNTDVVLPSDWNSAHAYTLVDGISLSGNTAGVLANISSGTLYLAGGNNITLSQNANSVTVSGGGIDAIGVSNIGNTSGNTGLATNHTFILAGAGNITLSQSTDGNGNTVNIIGSAVGPTAFLIGGNTAGATASITSGTMQLFGGNNITLSQNANSVTVSQYDVINSLYENIQGPVNTSQSINGSTSAAVSFVLPYPISASFLRIPASFSTASTSIATSAASLTGTVGVFTTWNAVVYSLGTGDSSRSLLSVASGSNGWSFTQSLSVTTNGTQYSLSQGWTGNVQGGSTTYSTSIAGATTLYSAPITFFTKISGARFLDINFNNSLSAGPYWLIFGASTSSTRDVAAVSPFSVCGVRYLNHYGLSQTNLGFAVMGSTNLSSGGPMGAGSFTTAGGGTRTGLPVSAISTSAAHIRAYFQLIRSA